MLKIIKKSLVVLLISITFVIHGYNFIYAVMDTEETLVKIGQADYHLKYYNETAGKYTYVICSIVGYYDEGEFKPAYCMDKNLKGIETVGDYIVDVSLLIRNDRIWRIIKNGYPNISPYEMGLQTDFDAYAVTKLAIYCILCQSDINLFYAEPDDDEAQAMLTALKNLVNIGENGSDKFSEFAMLQEEGIVEEDNYYSKTFSLYADNELSDYTITNVEGLADGDMIVDMNGNERRTFSPEEKFKLKILKDNVDANKEIIISTEAKINSFPIYYGQTRIEGTQNYAIRGDIYEDVASSIVTKFAVNTGTLVINKIDKETKEGIADTEFQIYNEKGELIDTKVTNESGLIEVNNLYPGKYKIIETRSNEKYIVDETNKETEVEIKYNQKTDITIENEKIKGNLQIIKTASEESFITGIKKGEPIPNIEYEIYDESNNLVDTIITNENGVATKEGLEKGTYTVKELESSKWYFLKKGEEKFEITYNGEIVTLNLTNSPILPQAEVTKVGADTAKANDNIEYDITVKNNGNVRLENFTLEEIVPTNYIRINKIKVGAYNKEMNYNLYYKTNLTNDYVLLLEDISSSQSGEIDLSKELVENEYITNIKWEYGTVDSGFETSENIKLYGTVNENVSRNDIFENTVTLQANYGDYNINKTASWKTKILQILPKTGM